MIEGLVMLWGASYRSPLRIIDIAAQPRPRTVRMVDWHLYSIEIHLHEIPAELFNSVQ